MHFSVISKNITVNHILPKTRFFGLQSAVTEAASVATAGATLTFSPKRVSIKSRRSRYLVSIDSSADGTVRDRRVYDD